MFKKDYEVSLYYNRGSVVGLTEEDKIEIYHEMN